jgi:hypothetical protein
LSVRYWIPMVAQRLWFPNIRRLWNA